MEISSLNTIFNQQKSFFNNQNTLSIHFRKNQLRKLKTAILEHEKELYGALKNDLNKSEEEAFFTEIGIVLNEIDYFISKIHCWSQDTSVSTPIFLLPSQSYIRYEPRGLCLIIVPFNYPIQLSLLPLIGAIGAGNCAIIKGSEHTTHTNFILSKIITTLFSKDYIAFIEGDSAISMHLTKLPFDFIFFTGSSQVGKMVLKSAAENLVPTVLELGGKSPCIVDASANIDLAAKRIVWGKFMNAGQTCVAPDFVVVHKTIANKFLVRLRIEIEKSFGNDASSSPYYGKIIHAQAYDRIMKLIEKKNIYYGGQGNKESLFISPTILTDFAETSQIIEEEIFGPILPIYIYENLDDLKNLLPSEKPLALYVFGDEKWSQTILRLFPSGGACINDVLIHVSNKHLPFGGVGYSGMGNYHGKKSFLTFSHERSIMKSPTWIDIIFRYPPYPLYKWMKKLFRA